jgi:hypothetical protein
VAIFHKRKCARLGAACFLKLLFLSLFFQRFLRFRTIVNLLFVLAFRHNTSPLVIKF